MKCTVNTTTSADTKQVKTDVPSQDSILCLWSSWGEWGECSTICGEGTQQRFRVFLIGQHGREGRSLDQDNCKGGDQETRPCVASDCPAGLFTSNINSLIQSFPAFCCAQVAVKSSGSATIKQGPYMGRYKRLPSDYNDHPAYMKNTTQPMFIYFFSYSNDSLWMIGPSLGQGRAAMKHKRSNTCVHSLGYGWLYQGGGGDDWKDDDNTLTVVCDQDDDDVIDDLVGLELNKTTLTIGLKTSQSEDSQKGNKEIKHKEKEIMTDSGDILIPNSQTKAVKTKGKITDTSQYGKKQTGPKKEKQLEKLKPVKAPEKMDGHNQISKTIDIQHKQQEQNINKPKGENKSVHEEERTQIKQRNLTAVEESSLTRCYSCGSLFSADSSDCESFDPSDKNQVVTCQQGEACLFYAWRVSDKETGQELHIHSCLMHPCVCHLYLHSILIYSSCLQL